MEKMSSSRDTNDDPFYQEDRITERAVKRRQRKPRITGQQKKQMTREPQRRRQPTTSVEKQLKMQLPLQAQQRRVEDDCEEGNRRRQSHQPQHQPEGPQNGAVVAGDVVASTNAPDRFFLRFEGITAVVHREMLPLIDHFMTIVLELKAEVDKVKRNRDTAYAENRILQEQLLMCHREHRQRYTLSQESQTEQHTQEQQTQTERHTKEKQIQTQQHSQKPQQYERHTPLQHTRKLIPTEVHKAKSGRGIPTQQPQRRPSELGWPDQTRHKMQSHQSQPARRPKLQGRPERSQQQQRSSPQRDKQKNYNRGRQRQRWKHKKHNKDADKEILAAIREVGQMVAMSPAASQVPGPPQVLAASSAATQSLNPASGLIPMSWSIGAQQQFGSSALIPMPNLSVSNGLQMSPYWQAPYF